MKINGNLLHILKLLYKYKSLSRADIARLLNIDNAAITRLTAKLINGGWIEELQVSKANSVGKPPRLLKIVPDAFFSMGICVGQHIDIVLHNAAETITKQLTLTNKLVETPDECIKDIKHAAESLISELNGHFIGICLTTNSPVNPKTKCFSEAKRMGGVKNAKNLLKELKSINGGVKVYVEKMDSIYILPEYRKIDNCETVNIIGVTPDLELSAIFSETLFSTPDGSSTSLSHMKVDGKNDTCPICTGEGCLCLYSSLWSMTDTLAGFLPGTIIPELSMQQQDAQTEELFKELETGSPRAFSLLRRASNALASILTQLCTVFKPDYIFLSGIYFSSKENGLDIISNTIKAHSKRLKQSVPQIRPISYGRIQGAVSAALTVHEKFLNTNIIYKQRKENNSV